MWLGRFVPRRWCRRSVASCAASVPRGIRPARSNDTAAKPPL